LRGDSGSLVHPFGECIDEHREPDLSILRGRSVHGAIGRNEFVGEARDSRNKVIVRLIRFVDSYSDRARLLPRYSMASGISGRRLESSALAYADSAASIVVTQMAGWQAR